LARSEKYRLEFKNAQGDTCTVQFLFEGWAGAVTYLIPAAKPFTLSEYNTSEDLFKPYRPQQATINIIASDSSVTMDSFLTDNDNDIEVIFSFGSFSPYWYGFILQDNFQETWIGTNHVLTLTATEGIGQLEDKQFSNNGAEVVGKITPWTAIGYCLQESPQNLVQSRVYNSLYHTSMNSTNTDMCLDQCYFDTRTFVQEPKQYDSKLEVLNKINSSFNQTMFQYKGQWYFLRLEDLYIPTNENLRGFRNQVGGGRATANRRYDANVGVGENMQQITPEMLRYINRRTKRDTIQKNYEMFAECVPNSSFTRGTLISSNASLKLYSLDNWNFYYGTLLAPVANTGTYRVSEVYIDTILSERKAFFRLRDNEYSWIESEYCYVKLLDTIKLTFDVRYKDFTPSASELQDYINDGVANSGDKDIIIGALFLETSSGDYWLNKDGKWVADNASLDYPTAQLRIIYDPVKDIYATDWQTISVTSEPIPYAGKFKMQFWGLLRDGYVDNQIEVKNFSCETIPIFNIDDRRSNITGHEVYYEKSATLRNEYTTTTYLEDNVSYNFKGSLFESDQLTFTNAEWFRYRYIDERYPFLQQALIPIWEHNRYNRNKIDVNCFGLKFNNNTDPIGLINTFIFVDDDPNKIYYVLNMREIDFDAATWSATLIEVYDSTKDPGTNVTKNFQADVTTGSYSSTNYVPWTIISAADFTLGGTTNITYNAASTITVNIACNVSGAITSSGTSPVEFKLYKNGSAINTAQVYINNNPEYFNVDLSTNGVSLANGDILSVWIDTNIYSLDLTGGSISFSYTSSTAQTFDTYVDRYLTN
jgi:hypothetical protein